MFFYFSKRHASAEVARVIKQVHCEKCGSDYAYEMIRRGTGIAESPYYLGSTHQERSAMVHAKCSLQRQLARDRDPVACPDCGWIQQSMVDDLRRRAHRWMIMAAWGAFAICVLAIGFGFLGATDGFSRPMDREGTLFVIGAAIAAVIVVPIGLSIRRACAWSINPNRGYPETPGRIPGAPEAVRSGTPATVTADAFSTTIADPALAAASTIAPQKLAYERTPSEVERGGWVTIQLSRFSCPPQCCLCLAATESACPYYITQLAKVMLPICTKCHRRSKESVRLFNWLAVVGCAAVGFFLSLLASPDFEAGPAVTLVLIGAAVGSVIARIGPYFVRPIRFSRFRPELNTVRVRFRNPIFRRLVLEQGRLK
jgi:hypothetical protein